MSLNGEFDPFIAKPSTDREELTIAILFCPVVFLSLLSSGLTDFLW